MHGNPSRCNCACHRDGLSVAHLVSCCCPHRVKRGYRCAQCTHKEPKR